MGMLKRVNCKLNTHIIHALRLPSAEAGAHCEECRNTPQIQSNRDSAYQAPSGTGVSVDEKKFVCFKFKGNLETFLNEIIIHALDDQVPLALAIFLEPTLDIRNGILGTEQHPERQPYGSLLTFGLYFF